MLPVPPPKMETKINGQNKTINLINEGEVNLLKTTGLTDISFTCLLPNSQYPFASYDASLQGGLVGYALGEVSRRVGGIFGNAFLFRGGRTFLDAIKIAKESIIPMRFIVSRMGFNPPAAVAHEYVVQHRKLHDTGIRLERYRLGGANRSERIPLVWHERSRSVKGREWKRNTDS